MNALTLTDTDMDSLSVRFFTRSVVSDEVSIDLNNDDVNERCRDISRNDARKLRDWLDEWLGDTTVVTGYTPQDVERLVREVRESMQNGNLNNNVHALYNDVLKPFLPPPDPDAELVEKMVNNLDRNSYTNSDYESMRSILAIVRAHDAVKS